MQKNKIAKKSPISREYSGGSHLARVPGHVRSFLQGEARGGRAKFEVTPLVLGKARRTLHGVFSTPL